ncbi:MAG TPA: SBBP repeat-containing protein [Candidatus Kapabacteria bacterium]|nr:SBBP repeat-containing protein [Candidatus Kapabacteria bacterium]
MSEADIKPFFPADSVVAGKRILHTLTGLGNNKAVTAFIAVICFLMTANLNAQTLDWVKTFGGIGYDIGNSVTVDDEGNIYTTGSFNDTVDFDPGPDVMKLNPGRGSAIFIQKLDANGNFIWAKSCGGKGNQIGQSIKVDAMGDVYTTGIFQDTIDFNPGTGVANLSAVGEEDVFILKLDANGNFLWAKSFGGIEMDRGYSIAIDAEGNVYTTGYFIDTVDFDPGTGVTNLSAVGGKDIFILKLDPNGNFVWAKSFGGTEGIGIAIDGMGNVITTGYFSDTVDFDPGTGVMNLTSAGETDIFILKLDANGNFLWAKSCGGYWIVGGGISITFDATNNVYTTGAFDGTVDFDPGTGVKNLSAMGESDIFIQKLDAQGNFIWAKTFGGNDFDQSYSIAIDAESNVYSIGDFVGTVDFDPGTGVANLSAVKDGDIFIQKLDAQGNFIWAKSFGGEGHNFGSSIDVDAANNIYTTGLFRNTVDFDPGTDVKNLKSIGGYDIYVHKMKQTATGVADIDNGIDISLYPNPSNGFIHIALNEAVGEASITITDLQGKIIHSEQMSAATKSSMDIQAPNGVYFVHVKTTNGQSIMKFIKE